MPHFVLGVPIHMFLYTYIYIYLRGISRYLNALFLIWVSTSQIIPCFTKSVCTFFISFTIYPYWLIYLSLLSIYFHKTINLPAETGDPYVIVDILYPMFWCTQNNYMHEIKLLPKIATNVVLCVIYCQMTFVHVFFLSWYPMFNMGCLLRFPGVLDVSWVPYATIMFVVSARVQPVSSGKFSVWNSHNIIHVQFCIYIKCDMSFITKHIIIYIYICIYIFDLSLDIFCYSLCNQPLCFSWWWWWWSSWRWLWWWWWYCCCSKHFSL